MFKLPNPLRALLCCVAPKVCAVFLTALLLFTAGCKTSGDNAAPGEGATFEIVADFTPFYRFGPEQAAGPDVSLQRGRLVTLVKRGFGYSQVKLDDGITGYVSTEDLSKVPVPEQTAPVGIFGEGVLDEEGDDVIVDRYFVEPPGELSPLPEMQDPAALEPVTESGDPVDLPDFRY